MKFVLLLAVFAIGALAICPSGPNVPPAEVVHFPSLSDEAKISYLVDRALDIGKHANDTSLGQRLVNFQILAKYFIVDTAAHERIVARYPEHSAKLYDFLASLKKVVV